MTLKTEIIKKVIKKLLEGKDYRTEIIAIIDAIFLEYVIDFFKKVINAKIEERDIGVNWYKNEFLNPDKNSKEDIIIHSGLNIKTVSNMYNTTAKEVAINASIEHYDILYESINKLIDNDEGLAIKLTIRFRDVSVDLNINESLIIINTIAVKRAQIRGGAWSTVEKQVEKPLIKVICLLFSIPDKYHDQDKIYSIVEQSEGNEYKVNREVDFFLLDGNNNYYRCEVKLMGKGNPESADVVIARGSKIFIADKLSETNKKQLDELGIFWVELRSRDRYRRFRYIFDNLNIPYKGLINDFSKLDSIFNKVF